MLAESLIDVPPDYYSESLPFNNTEMMNKIFSELEEKNLFMIHSIQEKEQLLEKLKQDEISMHYDLDKKYNLHQKNKVEIESKIADID